MWLLECPLILYTDLDRSWLLAGLSCKVADGPLTSANHLSRLEEEGCRDSQAEGLGGFEVDDQLRYDRASCRPQRAAPRMLGSHSQILRSHHQPALTTFLEHP